MARKLSTGKGVTANTEAPVTFQRGTRLTDERDNELPDADGSV